ncbi:MAG: tetratricopeptide repeat protein [Bacteroidetes bacterium]|nr:tetratricopeptide repeat protein [Bacteroidota bacterium]
MPIRKFLTISLVALSLAACKKADTALVIPNLMPRGGDSTSAEFVNAQSEVATLRSDLTLHPDKLDDYTKLAMIFLQEARVSGRHHEYFPVASRLLDETLRRDSLNFEGLVLRAGMQMTMHRFAEAKQTIVKAIKVNPHNSGAYGILADANTELGLYDEAVKAVDTMISTRPDLRSYARASYQRELRGDLNGALAAMRLAVDAGAYGQESREWSVYQYANLFLNEGKLDTAQFLYNGILEERPNYGFALSGLAMVAVAKHDYPTAIEHLVKATQVLPEHIFLEQLSDLYVAMGDREDAKQLEEKVIAAFAVHEADGWNVAREYALYCANHGIHLDEALTRAEADYRTRPHNIDALDTYAWCLLKNGRAADAAPLANEALRMSPLNPTIWYHAAVIAHSTGDTVVASARYARCGYLPCIYTSTSLAIR